MTDKPKTKNQRVHCGICVFWEAAEDPKRQTIARPSLDGTKIVIAGLCRISQPRLVYSGGSRAETMWPATAETDWCGEGIAE